MARIIIRERSLMLVFRSTPSGGAALTTGSKRRGARALEPNRYAHTGGILTGAYTVVTM